MDKIGRDVRRAVRSTPHEERERYASEWSADVAGAREQGADPGEVARGARTMARRRRMRGVEGALVGRRGARRGLAAWGVVVAVLAAAALLGGVFLLIAVVAAAFGVVLAFRAGVPSRASAALMIASCVVGPSALVFAVWAFEAMVYRRDAGLVEPVAPLWIGVALIVALVGAAGFVVALVIALVRESRINASRQHQTGV